MEDNIQQLEHALENVMEELARLLGFASAEELNRLVAAPNLSDPFNLAEFNVWRETDGTKAGLLAAFPHLKDLQDGSVQNDKA